MNRKILPAQRKLTQMLRTHTEWGVLPTAFLATLLALPVNAAVKIPADPLASGVRVAPNILFILDDSGSMQNDYMPDSVPSVSSPVDKYLAYTRNSLSYNPATTYQPWMDANGTRVNNGTGGTDYTDAYDADQAIPYTGVKDDDSTGVITTSGTINLSTSARKFYVPKDLTNESESYLKTGSNYNLYVIPVGASTILTSGTIGTVTYSTVKIDGSNLDTGTLNDDNPASNTTQAVTDGQWLAFSISNTTGNENRDFTYSVNDPSGNQVCAGTVSNGDTDTNCSLRTAQSGAYVINVKRSTNNPTSYSLSAAVSNSCDDGVTSGKNVFIDCKAGLPNASRDLAAELTNYATWYSYFRTRNKVAKAGAAEAFGSPSLGNKVRVGFTTIWDKNPFYIPVTDNNDGRFVDNDGKNGNPVTKSRSKWYSHLFAAGGNSNTPLQTALNRAGQYYSDAYSDKKGEDGPYGPETGGNTLSCRQNFTILTTDGYWNNSLVKTGALGDDTPSSAITNGPLAADGGVAVGDPNYKSFAYSAPKPYADGVKNTLADVAMRYWKTDLMPSLPNDVPSSYPSNKIGDDPAFWQHMVTFGISIGLKTTNNLSSVSDVDASTVWPTYGELDLSNPSTENKYRLDDLLHAAVNGHGEFVAATNPQIFADGLAAALAKINERTASFSNMGASDSTQMNNGTLIFTASYVSGKWSGLLRAEKAIDGSAVWKSTDSGIFAAYSSRNIFTRNSTLTGGVGAGGAGAGATFPTANQLTALVRSGGPANYAVSGSDNAEYIKGNQAKEGSSAGKLRVRNTVMGDIVNSSPAYVADSNTVFVGANDGMLHAFDGSTGVEQFAYIPGIINFGNLADLSRGDYEHRWFVDGPIAISPKQLSPDGTKNILVGTLGRGGKGVYALDVTAPASFTSSNVKWEVNSTNATPANDNMGMVLGAPVLAKVRNGGTMPSPTLTSAVLLGNGINSGSDKAVLLVLNMDTGAVIKEVATDNTTGNGLFAPTGIYAADGKTLVYAYAGDLQGNVWKFDLTSTSPSSWTSKKIFHAEKTAGTPQAITGGIASAIDPRTNKRWIFFGTGSYLTTADGNDSSTSSQSMYGVIDDAASAYTRSDLAARTVTDGTGADVGERYFQDMTGAMLAGKHGWYVDLTGKGERIVQNTQMDGSYMVTASMMPSGNSCADASGSGYINAITPFPDMVASGKSYFDRDGTGSDNTGTNGKPTGSVKTNGMPTLPLLLPGQLRFQTSSGTGTSFNKGQPQWNRVSWRELRND